MVTIVNKRELAQRLGVSVPTVSAWLLRYGADFPVRERGSKRGAWAFDLDAVRAFLRAREAEGDTEDAQRGAQLARLGAPPGRSGHAPSPASSVREELEAWRLRRMRREEAERTGALIQAEAAIAAMTAAFGRLGRDVRALVRQLGREQNWPDPYLRQIEQRLAEQQRTSVAAIDRMLADPNAILGESAGA